MQSRKIKASLDIMSKIFTGLNRYRVVGSILVAAINKQPHRKLNDLDLIVDKKDYATVINRFKECGFERVEKSAPGFKWDEYTKPNHLTFGVLLVGSFGKKYFEYQANSWLKLRILSGYLNPTAYSLYGCKIRGIPSKSVYEGIKIASLNRKRKVDRSIVLAAYPEVKKEGLGLRKAFKINIFGVNVPYLYTFYSQIYNLVGGVRQKLGKSYDTWS